MCTRTWKEQGVAFAAVLVVAGLVQAVPIENGGFETGDLTSWEPGTEIGDPSNPWSVWGRFATSVAPPNPSFSPGAPSVYPVVGNSFAVLHHDGLANGFHLLYQNVVVDPENPILRFWANIDLNPLSTVGSGQGSWASVWVEERRADGDSFRAVGYGGVENGARYGTQGWELFELNLTDYTSFADLRIRFEIQTADNMTPAHQRFFIDDVALVPEPASIVLLALGGLLLFKRRS